MNQLQDSINEKNRQIDEDQRAKNIMIQDIKRYSDTTIDATGKSNPSPNIPASELSSRDPNSSVSDSYGIPVISAINPNLNPSGFGTDVNRNNIKNYHANIGDVPDRTNKYLATDQYYYQQAQLYETAKKNDNAVITNLNTYIGTLNTKKNNINDENTELGKTNLTDLTDIRYSFNKVQTQNKTIENEIDQTLSNYATLNEKTMFQQKDIEFYKYANYYLFIAFYVLLAILGVVLFTMNFTLSFYVKIAILCVLALYPFVIGLIYQLLTILWNFVGALALGNVYNKRNDITGQADKSEVQP